MRVVYKKSHQRWVSLLRPLGHGVTKISLEIIFLTTFLEKLSFKIFYFQHHSFNFIFHCLLAASPLILGVHNQTLKFPICYQSSPPPQNNDSYENSDGSKTHSLRDRTTLACLLNTPLAGRFFPLQSRLLRIYLYITLPRL